ncbi:hypothetical protein BaRGS_00022306 [Batillaria attramentaria]|uniref:Uncharacterized protein n=1 Tax=Batillaria attramentaria TaxID=370345 RepID=A0ABD0KHM0_9CAEN
MYPPSAGRVVKLARPLLHIYTPTDSSVISHTHASMLHSISTSALFLRVPGSVLRPYKSENGAKISLDTGNAMPLTKVTRQRFDRC